MRLIILFVLNDTDQAECGVRKQNKKRLRTQRQKEKAPLLIEFLVGFADHETPDPYNGLIKPKWRNWQTRTTQNRVPLGHVGSIPTFGTRNMQVFFAINRGDNNSGMPRSSFISEFLFHYIPAILSIALTTALLYFMRGVLNTPLVALLYLLPVGASASAWGLGAGIIAALSAFLTFNYFFIEPNFTLVVHSASDLVGLFVFLIVAVAISQLVGRARAGQALAVEKARLTEIASRAKVLEESDRMKSALLSSVSHELRTPLSTIKAAATSLRSGEVNWDSKAREDLLEAIEDETDHLNLLVGNLLNMSRIEANALNPNANGICYQRSSVQSLPDYIIHPKNTAS